MSRREGNFWMVDLKVFHSTMCWDQSRNCQLQYGKTKAAWCQQVALNKNWCFLPKEILDLAKNHLKELPWTSSWKSRKLKRLDVPCLVLVHWIWRMGWHDITVEPSRITEWMSFLDPRCSWRRFMNNWCFSRMVENVELTIFKLADGFCLACCSTMPWNKGFWPEGRRIQLELGQLLKPYLHILIDCVAGLTELSYEVAGGLVRLWTVASVEKQIGWLVSWL